MARQNSIIIKLFPEEKLAVKQASEVLTINPSTLARMVLIERTREILKEAQGSN